MRNGFDFHSFYADRINQASLKFRPGTQDDHDSTRLQVLHQNLFFTKKFALEAEKHIHQGKERAWEIRLMIKHIQIWTNSRSFEICRASHGCMQKMEQCDTLVLDNLGLLDHFRHFSLAIIF
jgi:hypothetical protein